MSKPLTKGRKLQFTIISLLLVTLVIWGIAEVVFRGLVYMRSQKYPTQTTEFDEKMGWRAVPNFTFQGTVPDGKGNEYDLDFKTDENGFRYFGRLNNPDDKRLLVIGDSYTHAIEVSNDKTYYGLLADSLHKYKVELFAYGARGLGPLQQYLWAEKWYEEIEPDAVLWQFCFNDIYNSSYDLESTSYFNNNRKMRPYLENGEVVYKNPARLGMGNLRESSLFLDFILTKMEVIIEGNDHKNQTAAEDLVKGQGTDFEKYKAALATFDTMVKKMKKKMDEGMAILAFPVDNTQPYLEDMTAIFQQNGIPVVKQVPILIDEASENGTSVWAKDQAHWNENAHSIASEEIWKYLEPIVRYPDSLLFKKYHAEH